MKNIQENLARILFVAIVILIPAGLLIYQFYIFPNASPYPVINIQAGAPENGGFDPETIRIAAGKPVHLVIHAPDVMHGFAIGPGINLDLGYLSPGETMNYDLQIDQPGRYTLYCTVWCSPNHWRMRMTIEVYDPDNPDALVQTGREDVTILQISEVGIDIDAPHPAEITPDIPPSAIRGEVLFEKHKSQIPSEMTDGDWIRWASPDHAAIALIEAGFLEQDAWDIIAFLWMNSLSDEDYQTAETLYRQNCVGCHDEFGTGDGPGAVFIEEQNFHGNATPAAFTNYETMLGGNTAIYYTKLRRGGMGTSMPGFGNIFSQEDTWLLAEYVWTFVFDSP